MYKRQGPAVSVSGTAGVGVRDAVALATGGPGITIAGGAGNSVTRSSVVSTAPDTAAVLIQPNGPVAALTLDSSILSGGTGGDGAGLRVKTTGLAGTGDVSVTARHITVAGSANGIVLDSSEVILGGGSIRATVTDSIVSGANSTKNFGGLLLIPANVADLVFTRTDLTSSPEALFNNPAKRNYRLRAGSPAIDKGLITPGDSATDIEGQPRTVGAASDLGADEYVAPAAGPPPAGGPTTTTDGDLPKVVITKPKANEKIKLSKTKTTTTTKNGKKVTTKKTTRTKLAVEGTATDKSGVRGVVLTIEKLSSTPAATKPATSAKSSAATTTAPKKCRWLNPTKKKIVLRSCAKPVVLLAKLVKDKFTYKISSTIKLGPGVYRVIVAGADNAGGFGNSASTKDAIHRFTLVR